MPRCDQNGAGQAGTCPRPDHQLPREPVPDRPVLDRPVLDGSVPDHDEFPSQGPDATDPDADLRLELDQLRRAMRSRGTIDLARGILMAAFGLSQDDAWKVLVATSQHTNTKLRSLAEQVVDSTGGTPLPESVRKRLSAAVAETNAAADAHPHPQPQPQPQPQTQA